MTRTKLLTGLCQACGGALQFPAEIIGSVATCPHCGRDTELQLAPPPSEPAVPRRMLVYLVIALVILGLGLVSAMFALKRARKLAATRHPGPMVARPAGTNGAGETGPANQGFGLSSIVLVKPDGGSLTYAVGSLTNLTDRQRFGVRLELELLDSVGDQVGTAKDYQQLIEPRAEWRFRALVMEARARAARLGAIQEER